jgi:hypothetical protein
MESPLFFKAQAMRNLLRVPAFVLLAVLTACGGSSSTPASPGGSGFTILVAPTSASVVVGGIREFVAEARDTTGSVVTGVNFQWHSSNTQIATSTGGGGFRGVAAGVVTITATASFPKQAGQGMESVSSNGATLTVTTAVEGTAASGAPLAGASVSLRDARGQYAAASADAAGHFSIPVAGMTAPFLLKAQAPDGRVLYGTAADLGTANVDPYTDFLVREWYALRGGHPEAAFVGTGRLPDTRDMQALDKTLSGVLGAELDAAGLDARHFSLLHTPFTADHTGFDQVLDQSRVDAIAGRIEVAGSVILLQPDRAGGGLSVLASGPDGGFSQTRLALP